MRRLMREEKRKKVNKNRIIVILREYYGSKDFGERRGS